MDSSQAAAAAVLTDFTAAPTAGTLTSVVGAQPLASGAIGTLPGILNWEWTNRGARPPTLSSASEFLTVDLSAVLEASQVLAYEIHWEEGSN